MAQTFNAKNGYDAEFANLIVTGTLTAADITITDDVVIADDFDVAGTVSVDTIAEHSSGVGVNVDGVVFKDATVDVNGTADAIILDADADTTISAPTDDRIDFELNSVDHVVMKAVAGVNSGVVTNIVEIAATSPVDTTGTNTHNGLNIDLEIGNASGGTNAVNAIAIDNITGDAQVVTTAVLLGTGFDIGLDMQGTKLELDADNDTSIIASTDDQIDFEVNGALDFRMSANVMHMLSGSSLATDVISEETADAGVSIDGATVKDGRSNLGVTVQALTATGAITIKSGQVQLNHATVVIAATLAAPAAGDFLLIVNHSASGTEAHTVTLPGGVTWDGTNTIATFNAPGEALLVQALSATRWLIILNIGAVGLST